MDDRECRKTREFLIDSPGAGAESPPRAADHLESCESCREFAALLGSLQDGGRAREGSDPPDYRAADRALRAAERIARARNGLRRLLAFGGASGAIAAAIAAAGYGGYGRFVLAAQAAAFLALPFVGALILARRLRGGERWTA